MGRKYKNYTHLFGPATIGITICTCIVSKVKMLNIYANTEHLNTTDMPINVALLN